MKHIFLKEKKIVFESNYHVGDKIDIYKKKKKITQKKMNRGLEWVDVEGWKKRILWLFCK